VKKKRAREDLATAEADREQNTELEVYIQEEDVDENFRTAAVDLDAPSAVVEVVEKTATISNRSLIYRKERSP